ncbi:MAG TPA: carbohydrate kinase [Armatimonadota bacterium]|nr:carbohydrate kinase [Armatimonadota bacterium]
MPEAITLGELLIDFVSIEKDVSLTDLPDFTGAAGGAPANVAVGLARLGVSAGFIGKIGKDPFGEFLRRVLDGEGVDIELLRVSEGARTTLAFVATRSDGRKDICFYRNPGADTLLTAEEVNATYLKSARLFHFGSVSLSRSPAREATIHAAAVARGAGLLVSYDPNWRPTLWPDEREGKGRIWEAMALADVVHCAAEEWEFITGTHDLEGGARKILEAGPRLVVVTLGERGCYYDDGETRGEVAGFAVDVIDPLGAGDAFVAAMLSQLMYAPKDRRMAGEQLREVMTYANAAGALTCTRRGVMPALPTGAQLEEFLGSRGG